LLRLYPQQPGVKQKPRGASLRLKTASSLVHDRSTPQKRQGGSTRLRVEKSGLPSRLKRD
jgi:hypothetical protein